MFEERYKKQVELLLRTLPVINRQECIALKGGTAINLFVRNMPRLSVDIDLTYLPLNNRNEALKEIGAAMLNISQGIEKSIKGVKVTIRNIENILGKLIVTYGDVQIKIEVNFILRGSVYKPAIQPVSSEVQEFFQLFTESRILSDEDLYAGKICAALDRQHPRDLFDVMLLLNSDGISEKMMKAFVVYLAGHSRPMNELLVPKFKRLDNVFESQFKGMVRFDISLEELYSTREKLVKSIQGLLTEEEKIFLISIKKGEPDWSILGLPHIQDFPSIKWKLLNIRKMSDTKRKEALMRLEKVLNMD